MGFVSVGGVDVVGMGRGLEFREVLVHWGGR